MNIVIYTFLNPWATGGNRAQTQDHDRVYPTASDL